LLLDGIPYFIELLSSVSFTIALSHLEYVLRRNCDLGRHGESLEWWTQIKEKCHEALGDLWQFFVIGLLIEQGKKEPDKCRNICIFD